MNKKDSRRNAVEPKPPKKSSWGLEHGDQIVPGRLALKKLGGGTNYEVFVAWDQRLFSPAVIKLLRPDKVDDDHALAQLQREAEILARLSHPHLVRMFDAVLGGPGPHIVLEHQEGPRLSSLIRMHGRIFIEQLLPLALNLFSVLHYLAGEEIVHLDIKPGNIVMGSPPVLIDLSIARTLAECTRVSSPIGTDAYMPPEQCRGDGPSISVASDIWGVGASLYEAVSGERPFPHGTGDSGVERFPQLEMEAAALPKEIPGHLSNLIMECLQPEPRDRPSAAELAMDLEPLVERLPTRPVLRKLRPRLR